VPARDWRLRVQDAVESIERIERYTAGLSFDAFAASELVIDGVVRNLTTLGEVARLVPDDVAERTPHIAWDDMCAMRNFVVHAYHAVRLETVWETVCHDLPPLKRQLQDLLQAG